MNLWLRARDTFVAERRNLLQKSAKHNKKRKEKKVNKTNTEMPQVVCPRRVHVDL